MSTTPKAWMVTIHYGDEETGASSDVYAGTPEAAERIAEERSHWFGVVGSLIPLYTEVAHPLVDELALVKAERDELREALEKIEDHFDMDGYDADAWKNLALEMASAARSVLAKHPKP